jgi:predicted methyltransferase
MKSIILFWLAMLVAPLAIALDWQAALEGAHRAPENSARDDSRHPQQTLEFFGLEDGMTVVEIAPGGGWYTEILAPLMKDNGVYHAAHHSLNAPGSYYRNSLGKFLQKMAADPDVYGQVQITQFGAPDMVTLAPPGSADLVVGFRNVHSWLRGDSLDKTLGAAFTALKSGGTLGLVQHSTTADVTVEAMMKTGYVPQAYIVAAAEKAGFTLSSSSDINVNSKDTGDHPNGVWSLPPSFRGGETDKAIFATVGESNRVTLKFTKPG